MSKVMISMPDELLRELDRAAKERHKKRSELIKDLALEFLRGGKTPQGPRFFPGEDPFERIREHQFDLEPGESAEGLIRSERESH